MILLRINGQKREKLRNGQNIQKNHGMSQEEKQLINQHLVKINCYMICMICII